MMRIRIGAKFPSNISPVVCIDVLNSIVNHRLRRDGCLPTPTDVQDTVKGLSSGRCTRTMYIHVWVNERQQMNTMLQRSQYKPPNKKKLNKKTKDFFDTLKTKKTKDACSICLKENFKGVILPCGHLFHKSCIKKACQYDKRCPNCRKPIKA